MIVLSLTPLLTALIAVPGKKKKREGEKRGEGRKRG